MEEDRFTNLSDSQCSLLFECILHAVESNSGIGFSGQDQSHPDLIAASIGLDVSQSGRTEEKHEIFKMFRELCLRMADVEPKVIYQNFGATTWPDFCKMAVEAARTKERSYVSPYLRS